MITDNRQRTTDNPPGPAGGQHIMGGPSMVSPQGPVGSQWSSHRARWVVNILAHFFSYVLHPLFIPLYAISFLVFLHPSCFAGFAPYEKYRVLLTTALNTIFFPAFAVLLMKGLGFIKSVFLRTQQDRIGPYLSSMIFYFNIAWTFFKMDPQLALILP